MTRKLRARRCRILGIILFVTVGSTERGVASPRPDKDPQAPTNSRRSVCHRSPDGTYSLKEISASSLEKHIRHGDCVLNDGFYCTTDTCDKVRGCVHTADHARCDDGLFCTTERCDLRNGCLTAAACTPQLDGCLWRNDSCDEEHNTCVDRADDSLCEDGRFCTVDSCNADNGACIVADRCPALIDPANCLVYGCDEAGRTCQVQPLSPCCVNGVCRDRCAGPQEACTLDGDCCGPEARCSDSQCCNPIGGVCAADLDCCNTDDGVICPSGTCCRDVDGFCNDSSECCSGLTCDGNICRNP